MAQNEEALRQLANLLRKRALTARQIADLTECSKPIAYARIETLRARGVKFTERKVRQGIAGPKATSYRIVARNS